MRSSWSASSFAADRNLIYCLDPFSGYQSASGVWLLPAMPFAVTRFKRAGAEEVVSRRKKDLFCMERSGRRAVDQHVGSSCRVQDCWPLSTQRNFWAAVRHLSFGRLSTPWATAVCSVKRVTCSEVKGLRELWDIWCYQSKLATKAINLITYDWGNFSRRVWRIFFGNQTEPFPPPLLSFYWISINQNDLSIWRRILQGHEAVVSYVLRELRKKKQE